MSTRKSTRKKLANAIAKLLKQVVKLSQAITKPLMRWLLRSLFILHRRSRVATAGFVLPTAIMVTLVVTLLVTAIVLRSFDRVKNASNYRVNQAVFNAAAPAIERAQAKLEALFEDPTLPRSTPSEEALENAFNSSKYNFGDETRLLLKDEDSQGNESTIDTAWRFPVDTDNNGKFDSYTLYGIYFKSPDPLDLDANKKIKPRTPLQARTPPMGESADSNKCPLAANTSASLVDNSGWFRSGSKLKKSIFVYTATVPIVAGDTLPDNNTYETYKGEAGFSALEYQQDRARIPLANNAIVYEDDLQITPGSGIQINGRVFTNGNFLTGNGNNQYFQVSSPESCYYTEENSKIVVGGNMAFGRVDQDEDQDGGKIHLFNGKEVPAVVELKKNDKSVNEPPNEIGNNSRAFTARINALVTAQLGNPDGTDPDEVFERYKNFTGDERDKQRNKALETYFKDRTRRVPYGEVGPEVDLTANPPKATPQGKGDELRPQDDWIFPYDPGTSNSNNGLTLNIRGNTLSPAATEPSKQQGEGKELKIGDRVLIGHGLPAQWWDDTAGAGDFQGARAPQEIDGDNVKWNDSEENRFRTTQVTPLSDLGDTDRNGFWEIAAARQPVQPLEGYGGLRVVTGAGIYVDDDEYYDAGRTNGIPNYFLWSSG
ncbi:MAG: hypothetical protein F6K44_04465, partial [Moorea sp. SIO3E2]|nr:hypothetical protein [Moorena sp. SIO3E2]